MAAKESLRILIREGDALKKEVDAFALESQGVIEDMGLADRKQRLKKLQQRSKDLIKKATKAEQRVSKHTKGKEPTPINRFDEVKKDELKRLQNIKNRLEKLKDGLVPDETEEDYFRQIGGSGKETQGSGAKKVVSIVPAANSTLEDDEDEEVEEEQEGEKEGEGEENDEEMEDNPEEKNPSPKSGSKLKRLSLFRRSSKSGKDLAPKPKPADDAAPGETKREKKEREKQEKVLEKEKQEQAKREKREQEKREKLEREQREKERKKKEKEEKRETGKGKNETANGTLKEISEHSEEEDDDDGAEEDDDDDVEDEDIEEEDEEDHKPTPSKSPPKRILKSPFGRKPKTSETGVSDATDEPKSSKEKKGGGGWKLFQRKPDRKMTKEKETLAKESASKKDEKKGTVQEEEDEEEDEDEEDEEDEDDEDASLEDEEEEDVSGEEEEVSGEEEEEVEDEEEEDEEEDGEDEEDEEDDEEDDDEEEDYEDDSQFADELGGTAGSNASGSVFVPPDEGMDRFEAVCDFDPEQSDDLKFKRGDIVTVLNTRDDGWWMAEDEEGNRGLVPSTYLKLKKDYTDFRDLQSPEYDGEGRVPGARRKSGVQLWKGLRKAMNETSVTDVLTAMGAIPSGFRPSMTAKLLEDDQYTLCNAIKPRLSQSNLTFKDIFWDPQENGIRAQAARVQKMMSVVMVKNMPQVGAGLETKNRHIRVAVFDGEKVLSNVHTIQATFVESEPKTWKFSPKPLPGVTRHCLPTPPQMAGMLPSSLDGDCFVRTNHTDENIGILFEVCLSYSRTKTGEKGEFCCGWVHLPLFDDTTGAPTVNKVYEVPLKGGTPYEQDVEVDPSISRKASTSKFRSMMTVDKSPRLVVKLVTPTKEQKAELDTLPDTIVSSACYISALSSYRKLLADVLLIDRINPQNTDLIHNPILASFPKATLYPDIMDALRSCWADKKRMMKKSVKKDTGQVKKLFSDACMESVYPLLHSTTLPPYKFGDTENEQERWGEISSLMKESQSRGILHHLLKPGVMHAPFNTREVTFNLLEVYREES